MTRGVKRYRQREFASRVIRELGISVLLAALLFSGLLAQLAQARIGLMPTASAHALAPGSQGTPNHFDFSTNIASGGKRHIPSAPAQGLTGPAAPTTPSPIMPRSFSPSMSPASIPLSATQKTHFTTSDSRLDIDVPAGAVSANDVSTAGGSLYLSVTEIAPPSGSNAGGSGHVSFGTYLFQLVDGHGALATYGLRKPITLTLHYGSRDSAVDLAHAFVVLNGPLPTTALGADAEVGAETLTLGYDTSNGGVLTSLTSSLSSPTSALFGGVTYNAAGEVTGWASGTTSGGTAWRAGMSATYDGDLRLATSSLTLTNATSNTTTTIASVAPGYDAVGNVTSLTTTLAPVSGVSSGGSETQAFCYDALNRLVWASTQASGSPCGRAGSEGVSGAGYTASYSYDLINDLTSASVTTSGGSPLANTAQGGYAYNTANAAGHLHAVSSVGSGTTSYSAGYDAAGDMTCRALGSLSCTTSGAPTGQLLGYDALRRLVSWQNATTSPTASATYAYDGEGTRVWQQTTSGSGSFQTLTTTAYLLGHDEQTTTQVSGQLATTTATRYYPTPGGALLVRDATGLSYLATDHLGTPIATVNLDTGATLGEQLRAPYGEARYGVAAGAPGGGMLSTVGFTGQREDTSGLAYFNAREYDPAVGRFTSADDALTADPLLDGYAYVAGMVESAVDPSGHSVVTQTYSAGFTQEQEGALLYNTLTTNPDAAFYLYMTDKSDWAIALAYETEFAHTYDLQYAMGKGGLDYRMSHSHAFWNDPANAHALMATDAALAWLDQMTTGETRDGHVDMAQFHQAGRDGDGGRGRAKGDGVGDGFTDGGTDPIRGYADEPGGDGCGQSFAPTTTVRTPTGAQTIATLKPGDRVQAYDPATAKTSAQTVERVYIDHDHDLLDVTLRVDATQNAGASTTTSGATSLRSAGRLRLHHPANDTTTRDTTTDETIHTTASHPWLTADHGWVPAGHLSVGEPVRRADGTTAVVVALRVVPGAADMWDLTVSNVHTFAVGNGAFVVHNCGGGIGDGSGDTGSGTGGATGSGGGGNDFTPAPKTIDRHGNLTNGTYTINDDAMAPHLPGSAEPGESVFLSGVDAQSAVLDAAQFADENGLWTISDKMQARVHVENGPVGVIGRTGELTDWMKVTRTSTGFVHGWPSRAP